MTTKVTLDGSKPYAECRGDRTPEDPLYRVASWQGGMLGKDLARELNAKGIKVRATDMVLLPFDSDGELVEDDGKVGDGPKGSWKGVDCDSKPCVFHPLWDDRMRAYLAKKQKRIAAISAEEDEEAHQSDDISEAAEDVNLQAFLKGTANYEWPLVQAAARKRYSRVFASKKQLVEDLVLDERLVRPEEVCEALRRYLPVAAADPSVGRAA
jgi:hypothetical protein